MSVSLNGLTFGDLFDFVDLARRAGVSRDTAVDQEFDLDDQSGPHTLQVSLADLAAVRNPDFSGIDREHFVEVLDAVLSTDGDARGALDEIKLLRDRLI
ncbi:hypothetical protein [[Mycobacterium] nativiensis]|uniref:Uncharacterized protein n=1 Tax=[Mycobacterium] nativiensis TaxID=2855503 RepID=A0ABU5XSY6_9MYCO|nr:hypothetical protein [Mycolicibacter sp. MYC340]MEB3031084.1 hypothetical protein [Mycolicibacter sp. MYC340]